MHFWLYLEWGHISQVKGTVPHMAALTSNNSCKLEGLQATHTSDQSATNLEVPTSPTSLIIHFNNSQNSGKCYA